MNNDIKSILKDFEKLEEVEKVSVALSFIDSYVNLPDCLTFSESIFNLHNNSIHSVFLDILNCSNSNIKCEKMFIDAFKKREKYLIDAECCLALDAPTSKSLLQNGDWFSNRKDDYFINVIKVGNKKSLKFLSFLELSLQTKWGLHSVLTNIPAEVFYKANRWSLFWNLMDCDRVNTSFAIDKVISILQKETSQKIKDDLSNSLVSYFTEIARESLIDYRVVPGSFVKEDNAIKKIKFFIPNIIRKDCELLSLIKDNNSKIFENLISIVFKSNQELRNDEKIISLPSHTFLEYCRQGFTENFTDSLTGNNGVKKDTIKTLDKLFDFKRTLDLSVNEDKIIRDVVNARSVFKLPLTKFNSSVFKNALMVIESEDKMSERLKDEILISSMRMVDYVVNKPEVFKGFKPNKAATFYLAFDILKDETLEKLIEINNETIKVFLLDGGLNPIITEKMLKRELNLVDLDTSKSESKTSERFKL